MVQFIFTPWRDRKELLAVRKQFYRNINTSSENESGGQKRTTPSSFSGSPRDVKRRRAGIDSALGSGNQSQEPGAEEDERQAAVARVSTWMQRGNCPHMVESTALLTAAILSDEEQQAKDATAAATGGGFFGMTSSYAVRAAYSAAFSRFVTGLLDGLQDKTRKMGMYGLAKSVGLPATFVELRHQATHEQLPSLTRLRSAARSALTWIWSYYWVHLGSDETLEAGARALSRITGALGRGAGATTAKVGTQSAATAVLTVQSNRRCQDLLLKQLQDAGENQVKREDLSEEIKRHGEGVILSALSAITDSTRDSKVLRKALALTREIMEDSEPRKEPVPEQERMDDDGDEERRNDTQVVRQKGKEQRKKSEEVIPGWSLYEEDDWVPKPIGVV